MKRIISGITATGNLTLGNYIGAIKHILKEQENKDNEIYMFIADYHALSLPIDQKVLRENIRKQIAIYLSFGIDYKKINFFKQSDIIGHTEMFYLLSTITNEGQLKRMTQYKDKSQKQSNKTENIPMGLLLYPILMAADILLYNSEYVIVGKDQKQHLELTKELAERLVKKYKIKINIPKVMIPSVGSKIMSLRTPTKKMSKSDDDLNEVIFILDEPSLITKKIESSLTDSENKVYFDEVNKPGISNLLTIYSSIKNISIKESEKIFKDFNYKDFKKEVANCIIELLEPIQKKFNSITDKDIKNAIEYNIDNIQKIANKTLKQVREGFGIE